MKMWVKVLIVTLLVGVPAFLVGPVLFPPADMGVEPTAAQLPLFLFLAVGDAILLGLGVAFPIFGFPLVRQVSPDSKVRAWAMYLAIEVAGVVLAYCTFSLFRSWRRGAPVI